MDDHIFGFCFSFLGKDGNDFGNDVYKKHAGCQRDKYIFK